jgi:hypothetical protein
MGCVVVAGVTAALVGAFAPSAPARARPAACRAVIAKASAKFVRTAVQVLRRCRARVLTAALPRSTDCTTDPRIARATVKAKAAIAARCCGTDAACGSADDDSLTSIGWDVGRCPDFEGVGCAGPIASGSDVGRCLTCVGAAAAEQLVELAAGAGNPAPRGSVLERCQVAIGKQAERYVSAASRALRRCWDARNANRHANACPEPGDGRAAPALARVEARNVERICAACGGRDRSCGGGDDLTPAQIGFAATCPAVQVPGGTACARPVATLQDLADCMGCLARFEVSCTDRLAVPFFASYPAECNPPSGSCTAGVECATAADCPFGYACLDNGGGATYCVGPTCTNDAACRGGSVCRQYCTLEGCGPPRCQCPGFGCTGADALCIDTGGLACRKLCTQDSDCTDPFGLVCVNPGFGAGLCIASVPCQ